MLRGARWLAAPRPQLRDDLYGLGDDGLPVLREAEPAFEAANVLRLGRDLFYQVSRSGNELGLRWLRSVVDMLGDIRIHPLRGIYLGTHIDSTICFLRPGLALLNPERVSPETIPEPLRNWDIIWCPPMEVSASAYPHTLRTPWVGMNILMLDTEHAVVDSAQRPLIREFERRRITVIPHRLRHSLVLGGGFHCVTLDMVREGGMEDYLD